MLCAPIKINPLSVCAFCCTSYGTLMPAGKRPPSGKGKASGPSRQHIHPCAGAAKQRRAGRAGLMPRGCSGQAQLGILPGTRVLCVDAGEAADSSTGGVGRGRARVFSQVWALLAGRSREVWKGTKRLSSLKGHWWKLQGPAVPWPGVPHQLLPLHPISVPLLQLWLRSSLHLIQIPTLILSLFHDFTQISSRISYKNSIYKTKWTCNNLSLAQNLL